MAADPAGGRQAAPGPGQVAAWQPSSCNLTVTVTVTSRSHRDGHSRARGRQDGTASPGPDGLRVRRPESPGLSTRRPRPR